MKRIIIILTLISAGIHAGKAQDGLLSPDGTYMYERRDTCDLFMDVYEPAKGSRTTFMDRQKPTVLFMFGG